jgi:hypothetical protein
MKILDDIRGEALFVLHLHRVKDAAIGIDADKERVFGRQIEHSLSMAKGNPPKWGKLRL